jgi:hypothetical protein
LSASPGRALAAFTERFPRLSEEAITPVTNLIDRDVGLAARAVEAIEIGRPSTVQTTPLVALIDW